MKRSGSADLPLHYGKVPPWLYTRMTELGGAIAEVIVREYGASEFLRRLSDPFWFQSLGAVLGMDWHSSGITTSVMGALKRAINPMSHELGIYVCGGRGKYSKETPAELLKISDKTGLNGDELVAHSKLAAKVDNTAVQDGFQLYLHSFILTKDGEWSIVQQGMNDANRMARRYHWHSANLQSFIEEPHTAVSGVNQGFILNLTDKEAKNTKDSILHIASENPDTIIREAQKIILPIHHEVTAKDVDLKKLGAILALAYDKQFRNFEDLLLLKGLGPKTLRSLTMVSEVIHGTPVRFKDPARFSLAHGGKDGHPFPVQTHVYDETIDFMRRTIENSKMGINDKNIAIKKLVNILPTLEKNFVPDPKLFDQFVAREKHESKYYGGKTVFDNKRKKKGNDGQLSLF